MFSKILIANRGEIALRIIRTCKEMGIKTVAVYSTADKESLTVRFADEAVCIGPPKSADSYLQIPNIISAAAITNADAIHPGYGFLSENVEFAKRCREEGIIFVGPSPESMEQLGDKVAAKKIARASQVPVIEDSQIDMTVSDNALTEAKRIGYPIMVKAAAGGGGRGMRLVRSPDEFTKCFRAAQGEAEAAFGNKGVYLEKFIERPRHIEFQILADNTNNYNCTNIQIFPQKNLLILFPSYLYHKITYNNSDKARYSLAFNISPVGKIGCDDSCIVL